MSNVRVNCSAKIWIFWDDVWEEKGSTNSIQQLTMKLQLRQTSEVFYISTVYARCDALDRLELWKDLESLSDHSDVFWMVGGDFNVILDEAENLGGSQVTQQEMVDFATCVNICSLNE